MEEIQAILLGLVQGLTEFLPVSSSGHLAITKELFGVETENLSFEVAVHAATVLSTIVVFRKEIWDLLKGFFKFKYNSQTDYICKILVSMIPIMIVGLLFKEQVSQVFGSGLIVVGSMLLLTSVLLFLSDYITRMRSEKALAEAVIARSAERTDNAVVAGSCEGGEDAGAAGSAGGGEKVRDNSDLVKASKEIGKEVGYKEAIIIGLAQAVAVFPGLSRSGTTISTGLMCGVKRSAVAQFSFLMVLIPILGEAFLELLGGDFTATESGISTLSLVLGSLTAFVSGFIACKWMISIVKKARLTYFAMYCAIVGILSIIFTIW